jgi:hypothetical protein
MRLQSLLALFTSNYRFIVLLGLILGLLILGPVLEQFVRIRLLMDIFLTTIAISMVSVIGHRQKYLFKIGAVLAAVMILSLWVDNFFPIDAFAIASMIIGVIFTAIVIAHTLAFIINSKSVVKEVKKRLKRLKIFLNVRSGNEMPV